MFKMMVSTEVDPSGGENRTESKNQREIMSSRNDKINNGSDNIGNGNEGSNQAEDKNTEHKMTESLSANGEKEGLEFARSENYNNKIGGNGCEPTSNGNEISPRTVASSKSVKSELTSTGSDDISNGTDLTNHGSDSSTDSSIVTSNEGSKKPSNGSACLTDTSSVVTSDGSDLIGSGSDKAILTCSNSITNSSGSELISNGSDIDLLNDASPALTSNGSQFISNGIEVTSNNSNILTDTSSILTSNGSEFTSIGSEFTSNGSDVLTDASSVQSSDIDRMSLRSVDDRVEMELERLNGAITDIHTIDGQLFDLKNDFKCAMASARDQLRRLHYRKRKSIERTRNYFLSRTKAKQAEDAMLVAAERHQRAVVEFDDAKDNELTAERALNANLTALNANIGADSHAAVGGKRTAGASSLRDEGEAVLENWNRATQRVMRSSKQKAEAEEEYRRSKAAFMLHQESCEKSLVSNLKDIKQAEQYYIMKEAMEKDLQNRLEEIRQMARQLAAAKEGYKSAFSRIDLLAAELEQRRHLKGLRNGGLGGLGGWEEDMSGFQEIDDIDSVLEMKVENLSLCEENLESLESLAEDRDPFSESRDDVITQGMTSHGFSAASLARMCIEEGLKSPKPAVNKQQSLAFLWDDV